MAEAGDTADGEASEVIGQAGSGALQLVDAEALIDDIIAKKGSYRYTEGLSEANWEQVQRSHWPRLEHVTTAHLPPPPPPPPPTHTHARSWSRFLSS